MTAGDRLVLFSGGSGGAKLARGLADVLPPDKIAVIVNTGDDFEHLGLSISPDIDSVLYTLANKIDPARGWGRANESWEVMAALGALGGPEWFRLGDKDIALHLLRTSRTRSGERKDEITRFLARSLGVAVQVLPMSNDPVQTMVETDRGRFGFQQYFVEYGAAPQVRSVDFAGLSHAFPLPALRDLRKAQALIVGPSNPFVSIGPIQAVTSNWRPFEPAPVIAVSPLIGGKAVKGPTAAMMASMLGDATNLALARHYRGWIDALVIDEADAGDAPAIEALGIETVVTSIWLRTDHERHALAERLVDLAADFRRRSGSTPNHRKGNR